MNSQLKVTKWRVIIAAAIMCLHTRIYSTLSKPMAQVFFTNYSTCPKVKLLGKKMYCMIHKQKFHIKYHIRMDNYLVVRYGTVHVVLSAIMGETILRHFYYVLDK